jgi:hypothetical protein
MCGYNQVKNDMQTFVYEAIFSGVGQPPKKIGLRNYMVQKTVFTISGLSIIAAAFPK